MHFLRSIENESFLKIHDSNAAVHGAVLHIFCVKKLLLLFEQMDRVILQEFLHHLLLDLLHPPQFHIPTHNPRPLRLRIPTFFENCFRISNRINFAILTYSSVFPFFTSAMILNRISHFYCQHQHRCG